MLEPFGPSELFDRVITDAAIGRFIGIEPASGPSEVFCEVFFISFVSKIDVGLGDVRIEQIDVRVIFVDGTGGLLADSEFVQLRVMREGTGSLWGAKDVALVVKLDGGEDDVIGESMVAAGGDGQRG